MRPIKELGKSVINKISYVLFDIDDTITSGGKLMAESYSALWKLYKRGYSLIPVTGRPAGWCDLIIRQWPVRAVVGENGAFVYYCEGEEIKTFTHPSVAHPKTREKLSAVMEACLKAVPAPRRKGQLPEFMTLPLIITRTRLISVLKPLRGSKTSAFLWALRPKSALFT